MEGILQQHICRVSFLPTNTSNVWQGHISCCASPTVGHESDCQLHEITDKENKKNGGGGTEHCHQICFASQMFVSLHWMLESLHR
jgi:hypothetical protein